MRGDTRCVMAITAEEVLKEIGPVQEVLDAHDGIVNVIDTADGNVMLSLEGGCVGCSSTPMTAMQIYYSLKKLDAVNDVIFVNGELPEYMRTFIDQKMADEADEPEGEIIWLFLFFLADAVWIGSKGYVLAFDIQTSGYCYNYTQHWKWLWKIIRAP